jgi:hypothetical protein
VSKEAIGAWEQSVRVSLDEHDLAIFGEDTPENPGFPGAPPLRTVEELDLFAAAKAHRLSIIESDDHKVAIQAIKDVQHYEEMVREGLVM